MQKPFIFGALALISLAGGAHADVTWEHSASISLGNTKPLVKFNLRNDWSGDNHRARFSFDAGSAAGMAGGMGSGVPARGTLDVIERLGDDKLIFALRNSTNTGVEQYVEEPYSTLKSRLRINFFEAFDPKFAATAEPVPALTDAQRKRLGQELRAFTRPIAKATSRQYFRALPNTRVINGLTSHGYRFTSMTKIPETIGAGKGQWVRMASELWVTTGREGDDEILSFTQRANEKKEGAATVSMWINEIMPIMMEAMPEESQAYLAAFIGKKGDANYGFKGTPTQFSFTVTPPPAVQMMSGEIRFRADLKSRSNTPIAARAFATPTEGQQIKIEPFLGIIRNLVKQGRDQIEKGLGNLM